MSVLNLNMANPTGHELVDDKLDTLYLQATGNDHYTGSYPGFAENGVYRLVIYADGLAATSVVIEVNGRSPAFLPVIQR